MDFYDLNSALELSSFISEWLAILYFEQNLYGIKQDNFTPISKYSYVSPSLDLLAAAKVVINHVASFPYLEMDLLVPSEFYRVPVVGMTTEKSLSEQAKVLQM